MAETASSDQNKKSEPVEFLLTEYKLHLERFWRSEELGERRVNFFLSITTGVLAALAIRQKGVLVGEKVDPVIYFGFGAVLLFGLVTLARLIRRNLNSHEQLRATNRIRRYFTDRYDDIRKYLHYEPYDDRPQRHKNWRELFSFGTGGLVETVSLVNSCIFSALITLFLLAKQDWHNILIALVSFAGCWSAQFAYVKYRYDKNKPTKDEIRFPGN